MDQGWHSNETDELREMLAIARRHLGVVLKAGLAGLVVGLVALFLMTPRYEAKARLIYAAQPGESLQPEAVFLEMDTHAEMIASPMMAAEVARSLSLATVKEFASSPGFLADFVAYTRYRMSKPVMGEVRHLDQIEGWGGSGASEAEIEEQILAAVPKILSRLEVQRMGNTALIELRFTSMSAERAAEVANAFAGVYLAYLDAMHQARGCTDQGGCNGRFAALKLVAPAVTPQSSDFPRHKAVLAIFTMIGLLFGLALAMRAEWTGRR